MTNREQVDAHFALVRRINECLTPGDVCIDGADLSRAKDLAFHFGLKTDGEVGTIALALAQQRAEWQPIPFTRREVLDLDVALGQLCSLIEKLPAGEQQTSVSLCASDLAHRINRKLYPNTP